MVKELVNGARVLASTQIGVATFFFFFFFFFFFGTRVKIGQKID